MWTNSLVSLVLAVGLMCPLFAVGAAGQEGGALRTGVFAGPVIGLKYQTPTVFGMTNEKGEFQYREGEAVTFSVGNVVLGTARGAERVNEAQLISRVSGNIDKVRDPGLTNLARFLQTLDQDGNVENGVTIAPQVHTIVGSWPINLAGGISLDTIGDAVQRFSEDPAVTTLLTDLNKAGVFTAGTPRQLRTPAAARNAVRRNIRGIVKTTDVKIPLRDGSFAYADVFRPAQEGKYPVVMNLGVYGKAFLHGCVCNAQDEEKHEEMEDRFFSGNPDGYMYENHESVDTSVWVPEGYVVVRVDGRGTCKSPGTIEVFGIREAETFYDAIEWAAQQPWSNGNVGLWGMSYYAMNQHNVASLQPPHLKAMIPIGTDTFAYEEDLYHGGIYSEAFWPQWWKRQVADVVCGELKHKDFVAIAKAHPFNEPDGQAIYGPEAEVFMSPDLSKVTVPQWVTMATTHAAHLHQRGSSEAYIQSASRDKKLSIVENWFLNSYTDAFVSEHMAFFDYWLKGINNGIMDRPPVRMWIRTGNGSYYVQDENEWPIAGTKYAKLYLDASPSPWAGDGRRKDFQRLSPTAPSAEKSASYTAQADLGPPPDYLSSVSAEPGGTPCWAMGASFVTDPMPEDMVLAGYMKLALWVSATHSDMDIYASVRVIDDQNREVNYSGPPDLKDPTNVPPLGKGWLKVSHRKLDEKRSTVYRPIHTHLEADYAPVRQNEVVPVEVEIVPNTALVKKGSRIRLDIQPRDGCGHGTRHAYDASYHTGAENTIYTGPKHPSYLQLPIIPAAGRPATFQGGGK